ncbi:MAG: AAA family ATPase [Pseudomonadota bacterium]
MANENALFEDDFSEEFEDEFSLDNASDGARAPGLDDSLDELVAAADDLVEADDGVPSPEEAFADIDVEGGDKPIPAITIQMFWEKPATCESLEAVLRDRRLVRTAVELHEGGLAAAIEHQQANATPNLIIVESSLPASEMVPQIDELAGHCDEGVEVLVIGAMNDIALYRQLVARGVSEYLVPPVQPVQLIRSIASLFVDPDQPFVGKSISVIGAKGGVGSSTVAHNLAWAIAEGARLNTALVDLDLSFGTTALDFNEDAPQTVADALLAPERADDAVISRLLSKATDRLSLFTAPASVSQVMEIPASAYDVVIEGVRRTMPYVVLDIPHMWTEWTRQTLVGSDEVILVCQPELASLRNGKNMIDQLAADRPNDAPPRLVINMAGVPKRPEIPVKDFAAAIGLEPEIILPFEPQLFGTASNNGQMISEADPSARSSLAIDHLAGRLTGKSVVQAEKSLFKKLLGK